MERQGNAPPDDIPVVLVREGHHGPVIHAANARTQSDGIHPGARLVDMRAICPELHVEYADPAGDTAALERLVLWVRRFCPWSVRDGEDGLILDITGSAHLFGGEAAMLVEIETQLSRIGLSSKLAVAPTWGAAWALARYGAVRAICSAAQMVQKLGPLPVAGLRLNAKTVLLMQRLGLKTIGAVIDVPRLSLTRRFVKAELDANPLMRLDQALGKLAEPVASEKAPPVIRAQARLAEPIFDPAPYLPELCRDLCAQLKETSQGCRRLHLVVYRTDGDVAEVQVATSVPTRDPDHFQILFRDKLERINPGFGFDLITLHADGLEELAERQHRIEGGVDDDVQLNRLVDRLTAKFGTRAVTRLTLQQSHIPERAEGQVAALANVVGDDMRPLRERPLRLLDFPEEVLVSYAVPEGPPAQFIWRRQKHLVARYAGPERVAPEWWRDRPNTRLRDYFKVEDQRGQRLWLYREGLHGDGRGAEPRWFVHGFFA